MSDEQDVNEQLAGETPQPGWRRVTSSKWAFAVGVSAIVFGVGVLFIVSNSGDQSGGTGTHTPTAPSTPLDPIEQCVVGVMGLHAQTIQAVRNGYKNGLDINSVAAQYGDDTPIFHAWSYTQATLITNIYSKGVNDPSLLTDIQPQVRQLCQQYAAGPS